VNCLPPVTRETLAAAGASLPLDEWV
jgi:hypothetical protein